MSASLKASSLALELTWQKTKDQVLGSMEDEPSLNLSILAPLCTLQTLLRLNIEWARDIHSWNGWTVDKKQCNVRKYSWRSRLWTWKSELEGSKCWIRLLKHKLLYVVVSASLPSGDSERHSCFTSHFLTFQFKFPYYVLVDFAAV